MGTKLYVGNLGFSTTEAALKTAFSADGRTVRGVIIPNDRATGRGRGFAFVEMGSESDARAAIDALNGTELDGRNLKVDAAQERVTRPPATG